MSVIIGKIGEFDETKEEFYLYLERLKHFFAANGIAADKQSSTLMAVMGRTAYKLLRNLMQPTEPKDWTMDDIVKKLSEHYKPAPIIIAERFRFLKRDQNAGESIADYIVELRRLASTCEYGSFLNDALRDKFVCGLANETTQRRLLSKKDLKLTDAVDTAAAMEMVDRDSTQIKVPPVVTVSKLDAGRPVRQRFDKSRDRKTCYRCGYDHPVDKCKYVGATCHSCGKIGHISPVCKSRMSKGVSQERQTFRPEQKFAKKIEVQEPESDEDSPTFELYPVYSIGKVENCKKYMVPIKIAGVSVEMELDTAADIAVVGEKWFKANFPLMTLNLCRMTLLSYSGGVVEIEGQTDVTIEYKGRKYVLPLVVVKGDRPGLFGRNWIEKVSLDWKSIFAVAEAKPDQPDTVEDLLKDYSSLFEPTKEPIRDFKATIKLRKDAKPVFCKHRPVPYALKSAVEAQIQRHLDAGIWERVEHSEWATPLVNVVKPDGSVRCCGDFKITVNPCLDINQYPLPTQQDIFATLCGGEEFSSVDCSDAYEQIELDKQAQEILTLNTHMGLMRPKRLVYGFAGASAIFQRAIDQIIQGVKRVVAFQDDTMTTAPSRTEHMMVLRTLFQRFRKYNVCLNRKKCKFLQKRIKYLGHIIDKDGIHPTTDKVDAINKVPSPKNVSELRSFLGLLNYYCKFLKDLSTKLTPLYSLLQDKAEWNWTDECERTFQQCKGALTSEAVLVHYDVRKPLRLTCDASPVGVGAILSHIMANGEERPIGYSSQTLTQAQRGYPQGEREALAIVCGVQKFYQYLVGREFTLVTDHLPLVAIFGDKRGIPTLAAERIRRWALLLSTFRYKIEYKRGSENVNADVLSRMPISDGVVGIESHIFKLSFIDEMPIVARNIGAATRNDKVLGSVLRYLGDGWPDSVNDPEIAPFSRQREELSIDGGCIVWGMRVVIPTKYRPHILDLLHDTHSGMVKMKSIARAYVWWPGLDAEIESVARKCHACQQCQADPPEAPFRSWSWPSGPYERIHIDFAKLRKVHYLIIYDSFSKWIDVIPMATTTSERTIEVLRWKFADFGVPVELVSDNGPQFSSVEFATFLAMNGIKQTLVPAYHPASNGAAERAVRTFKESLERMMTDEKDNTTTSHKITRFLLRYRNTPHAVTGRTPAELFICRNVRTRFSLVRPDVRRHVNEQLDRIHNAQTGRCACAFEVGQAVWIKRHHTRGPEWVRGIVSSVQSSRTYIVAMGEVSRTVHVDQMRLDREMSNDGAAQGCEDRRIDVEEFDIDREQTAPDLENTEVEEVREPEPLGSVVEQPRMNDDIQNKPNGGLPRRAGLRPKELLRKPDRLNL